MAVIRVTCGAVGITYKDSNGQKRYALKDMKSKPFECDDEVAKRFVRRGVAEYVGAEANRESLPWEHSCRGVAEYVGAEANAQESVLEAETKETMQMDQEGGEKLYIREELEKMKNEALKNLAESLGIDVSVCTKKAEYVEAILEGQEDELPDLEAEDPVG